MNKLILFDIDKTLLTGGNNIHRSAFSQAIKKFFNIDTSIDVIDHAGKTDKQILIEVLSKEGIKELEARGKLGDMIEEMSKIFEAGINSEKLTVANGVRELLEALSNNNVLVGLLTGNLEVIAKSKMKNVFLDSYFKVGGFGSDDEVRSNLIKIAIKRAKDNFGFKCDNNVFVIGDTPRDIEAGKDAGVKTVGVATGKYSIEELKMAGADYIFNDLSHKEELLGVLLSK